MADDDTKHIHAQGREAKKMNEEEGSPHFDTIYAHSCPYGPGENRDAWLAGFGGQEETVEQVDTSTPSTGETSLVTKVEPTHPELGDQVPTPETVIGDPAASTNPAVVQTVDEATGNSVKPADLM